MLCGVAYLARGFNIPSYVAEPITYTASPFRNRPSIPLEILARCLFDSILAGNFFCIAISFPSRLFLNVIRNVVERQLLAQAGTLLPTSPMKARKVAALSSLNRYNHDIPLPEAVRCIYFFFHLNLCYQLLYLYRGSVRPRLTFVS